jgi:ElaB/YqjD/DUF883 family membrane-anchored ribosome-binding protein
MSSKNPDPTKAADDGGGVQNLAQVREILFGNQARDFDKRFTKLEARIEKELKSVRNDLKKRVETLERYAKKEVASLSDSIKGEQRARTQAVKDLVKDLKQTASQLSQQMDEADEKITRTERDLNQNLLEEVTALRDELAVRGNQLEHLMEQEASDLRDSKTDRAVLSALLQEMALRLTDSLNIPEVS